tara:strand:+ start:1477 stop:1773 length:297 start_codon:yes stop_codon:yes gene_type:complete
MPKGHKSKHGYATVSGDLGGLDYRAIAEKMSSDGFKMNHATARNVFLRAMRKLAEPICEIYHNSSDADLVDRTARDPRFQSSMIEIVAKVYDDDSVII